jgi:phage gp37-like protein
MATVQTDRVAPGLVDPIGAWEQAIIARCRELVTWQGQSLVRTVQSLPSQFEPDALMKVLRVLPAVFVSFGGGAARPAHGPEVMARWVVYVVTNHAHAEASRRVGDKLQPGAYALVNLLVAGLHQWAPDEQTNSLVLVDVQNLYTGVLEAQGATCYGVTLEGPLAFMEAAPAELAEFLTFNANLDAPPFAEEGIQRMWLDANDRLGKPDARETVKPRGE